MLKESSEISAEHEELLVLLRTKGLSIKKLDERKKSELREFLENLHVEKGLSLNDIAKLIGNKTSGYTSWLCRQLGVAARPFEEARLKGIKEKRRKYERNPFDGTDEDKAYLLGLRHGDLSVSKPWTGVVRVSTSTTHPAMARLFQELFEPYGHVYQHPRHKKDTDTYEWNLSTILDDSFSFLMQRFEEVKEWLGSSDSITISYLSGLLDAEGSIITTRDGRGLVTVFLDYYNSNRPLLEWIKRKIEDRGYHCSLRLNKKEGVRTKKYGIVHRKDYWQLSTFGMGNVQEFVQRIKPRHPEKVARRRIALEVARGQKYSDIEPKVKTLRAEIKNGVREFVEEARTKFLVAHQLAL